MGRHELAERVVAHPGGGEVALLAQVLLVEVLSLHARTDRGAVARLLHAERRVQGAEGGVEGVGRRRAGGRCRVVGTRDRVAAGVVGHRRDAAVIDGGNEIRRDERVGLGLLGRSAHARELGAQEHEDEYHEDGPHNRGAGIGHLGWLWFWHVSVASSCPGPPGPMRAPTAPVRILPASERRCREGCDSALRNPSRSRR